MPCRETKHGSGRAEKAEHSAQGVGLPRSPRTKGVRLIEVGATPPSEAWSRASPSAPSLDPQDLFPYTQFFQSSGVGSAISQAFSTSPPKSRSCPQIYTSTSTAQCVQPVQPAVVNPYARLGVQTPPLELALQPSSGLYHALKPCTGPRQPHAWYEPHVEHQPYKPNSSPLVGPESLLDWPRHSSAPLASVPQLPPAPAPPPSAETRKLLRYQCSRCLKIFTRSSALQSHILVHTGDRPFMCPNLNCSKSFNVKSNMIRHLKIHRQLVLRRDST
ncbi:LAQU0S01e09956g1_1 [Lachancea quebecensis]|uniref:LAQU0S01e09956g1_1 n=1 Tax=Lachancea quebecensis TaxID=1654605 RepID=A0A0P1KMB3_9SACH|nr:LAQU0S01e09956g1_1 [Lachancea quebecensis]